MKQIGLVAKKEIAKTSELQKLKVFGKENKSKLTRDLGVLFDCHGVQNTKENRQIVKDQVELLQYRLKGMYLQKYKLQEPGSMAHHAEIMAWAKIFIRFMRKGSHPKMLKKATELLLETNVPEFPPTPADFNRALKAEYITNRSDYYQQELQVLQLEDNSVSPLLAQWIKKNSRSNTD